MGILTDRIYGIAVKSNILNGKQAHFDRTKKRLNKIFFVFTVSKNETYRDQIGP